MSGRGQRNPSMQCSLCGRWMRLHGRNADGTALQRFYGSCAVTLGDHPNGSASVCDECCREKCAGLAAKTS